MRGLPILIHGDAAFAGQGIVAEWRAEAETFRNSDAIPMRPERVCKEITDALPKDAIVVSDTGHSGMWTATMIDFRHATQKYIRCAGSMGWGFPGALGVKCAVDDRPVVVDFVVGKDAQVWPMVAAGTGNDQIMAARGIRPLFDED